MTGGLAPIGPRIDDVYRATYARTLERGRRYYERYPGDRERVLALREHLQAHDVRLPSGDRLTARRAAAARRHAGDERRRRGPALHPRAARRLARLPPRRRSGARLRAQPALRRAPGGVLGRRRRDAVGGAAAAALRLRGRARALLRRARLPVDVRGLRRAGPAARGRRDPRRARVAAPLRPRSPGAPTRCRWPPPSTPRTCTSSARSPRRRAAHIRGLRPWLTNEHEHNGLRADGARILGHLIDLARGRA